MQWVAWLYSRDSRNRISTKPAFCITSSSITARMSSAVTWEGIFNHDPDIRSTWPKFFSTGYLWPAPRLTKSQAIFTAVVLHTIVPLSFSIPKTYLSSKTATSSAHFFLGIGFKIVVLVLLIGPKSYEPPLSHHFHPSLPQSFKIVSLVQYGGDTIPSTLDIGGVVYHH